MQILSWLKRCFTVMLLPTVAAVWATTVTADASAAHNATASVGRCGELHASVPYSRHGNRYRWGVYVIGSQACHPARLTLNAVMHLRAAQHVGTDNANSYFTFHGWRCDFGQMGAQACWTPSTRPYRVQALALACDKGVSSSGCPARIPRDYLG